MVLGAWIPPAVPRPKGTVSVFVRVVRRDRHHYQPASSWFAAFNRDAIHLAVVEAEHGTDGVDEDFFSVRNVEPAAIGRMQVDGHRDAIGSFEDRQGMHAFREDPRYQRVVSCVLAFDASRSHRRANCWVRVIAGGWPRKREGGHLVPSLNLPAWGRMSIVR